MTSRRARTALAALAALAVTGLGVGLGAGAPAALAASGSTSGAAADPDTLQAPNGSYYTYSTSSHGMKVPLRITPTADIGGVAPTRDALPNGPGAWADGCTGIWAPSVVQASGKWFMYYTASRSGTSGCAGGSGNGHKCIGRAVADNPAGPFTGGREVACPAGGRWALDPDAVVTPSYGLVMVYRDDAVTSGAETGISVVQMDADGFAKWSTRVTLLKSTDITWDTAGDSSGTHIVENPSLVRVGGTWRLFFSGNKWDTRRYAVGLANCGESVMVGACTPTHTGRPWFGYVGTGDIDPVHQLPGNHTGPGGLAAFTDNAGNPRVVWHWYNTSTGVRPAMTGLLSGSLLVS